MVMGPDRLLGALELMDLPDADPGELAHTLNDLAWINRWLGGMRLIRAHLPSLLDGTAAPIRILDVGTGYADLPRAIARWGRRWGLPVEIEGIDHHEQIVRLARQASAACPEIRIRRAEALSLPYPEGASTSFWPPSSSTTWRARNRCGCCVSCTGSRAAPSW